MENWDPMPKDERLMILIRRGVINTLWSHEPGTVSGNFMSLKNIQWDATVGGLSEISLSQLGTMPL